MFRRTLETGNTAVTERPCAASGLTSYRYLGRYGWIMIGATDSEDALNEARRSTAEEVTPDKLEVWNGTKYESVRKG